MNTVCIFNESEHREMSLETVVTRAEPGFSAQERARWTTT
jgi:hypothetical protein